MARVPSPEFDPAKVVVLPHAVERAGLRGLVDDSDRARAREEIKAMVVAGCERGHVYDSPPRPFRASYDTRPKGLPFWQRAVVYDQRSPDGSRFEAAFIVDVSQAPMLTVITSYQRFR